MKFKLQFCIFAIGGLGLTASVPPADAQVKGVFQVCDNNGCREVDPYNPPPLRKDPAPAVLIDPEGYRGEPLADLEVAAAADNISAAYKLGLVYKDGLAGQPMDLPRALSFFETAAAQGDPVSARHAALLLMSGRGGTGYQSLPPRFEGDDDAQEEPEESYGPELPGPAGPDTPQAPTSPAPEPADPPAPLPSANAQQKAIQYFYAAAGQGDAIALLELGKMIYSGQYLSRNTTEAGLLFEEAAALGSSDAQYFLGQMHFRGEGRPLDGYKAIEWTRKAANNGSILGQRALGQLYINGYETIAPDPVEAERWLYAAGQNGDVQSANLLSLLQSGQYVPGGDLGILLSAGDMVRASSAAMTGITELRRRIAEAQAVGRTLPTETVEWAPVSPGAPSPGRTSVRPSQGPTPARGGECYIVEHVSFVEGKSMKREEQVCEAEDGSFQVAA